MSHPLSAQGVTVTVIGPPGGVEVLAETTMPGSFDFRIDATVSRFETFDFCSAHAPETPACANAMTTTRTPRALPGTREPFICGLLLPSFRQHLPARAKLAGNRCVRIQSHLECWRIGDGLDSGRAHENGGWWEPHTNALRTIARRGLPERHGQRRLWIAAPMESYAPREVKVRDHIRSAG